MQVMPHRQRCVLQAKGAPSRCQEWPIAAARMLLTSPMLLPSLLQLSEAISAAEGHIAGPGVFQLTVRGEPQAVSGGNGFVAASSLFACTERTSFSLLPSNLVENWVTPSLAG
eukprot:scaffold112697_cov14-Tisochrysis_lutea.AAC.1